MYRLSMTSKLMDVKHLISGGLIVYCSGSRHISVVLISVTRINMVGEKLAFDERKAVLKWYIKYENINEIQGLWRNEFQTQPPTNVRFALIRDKFEVEGCVKDAHEQRSGRPVTGTSPGNSHAVLQQSARSPKKFETVCP